MSNLRLYTFCNVYLSSIQQGIQSAHVTHELFVKYKYNFELSSRLFDWAENHKTMIVLNGGINESLHDLYNLLTTDKLSFPAPFACFNEDEKSLGGIMTNVGIVLPEEIYDVVNYRTAVSLLGYDVFDQDAFYFIKDGKCMMRYEKDTPDWRFINILKSCPLAR